MSKFKIGDKVKIVGKITYDAMVNFGKTGYITRYGGVADLSQIPKCGYDWYYIDNNICAWDRDIELADNKKK